MAKKTPKELALALYLATRTADSEKAAKSIRHFVATMKKEGFAQMLPEILSLLPKAASEADGEQDVLVETAGPVAEELIVQAIKSLGVDPKKAVIVRREDPELIGGLRVKTKDKLMDLSIRKQLEDLKTRARK